MSRQPPDAEADETVARLRGPRPSRKLTLRSRVRAALRRGADAALAADLFWSVALVLVVGGVLGADQFVRPPALRVGAPAAHDIKAPADYFRVEDDLTEERRKQARESVPDVYVYDTERGTRLAANLGALFERGRRGLEAAARRGERDPARAVAATLEPDLAPGALAALIERGFDARLQGELQAVLTQILGGMIVANRTVMEDEPAIVLLRLPDEREDLLTSYDTLVPLARAREAAAERARQRLDVSPTAAAELGGLVASYVDANVQYDATRTQQRREAAARGVRLVLAPVKRGDLLLRKGETVTEDDLRMLESSRGASAGGQRLGRVAALGFIASALAFFLWRYSRYHQRGFRKIRHLHALLVSLLLSMLLLGEAVLWVAGEAADNLNAPFNLLGVYAYLVPVGAGSILVALLTNGRIAIVYSGFLALLFGAANGWNAHVALWAMLVQCAGVYAISAYRERAALLRAGFIVGGAGALAALAVEILQGGGATIGRPLYAAALAFVGGALGAGLLVSFSLPLLERVFNVLTEIRLLELSNVNNPLLSQLAVKAPGSYHHSLVVGTLAEEAAKAIGASSLFCRVAAFYHDVGKMNMPEYFVENQRGTNPHERLAASMSALIIASHVKDGIKMAREAGLPEQIVDIIPQHHGTRLMTYFVEKARSSADPALGPVQEDDFRYPGPKPQTREAAIFMIADAIEAAARTVDDPTPNRLRDLIRKVTNAIVLDGQLDECDLTFIDLEKIQQALLRLLSSMYHHRVDYPGFDFNRPEAGRAVAESGERRVVRGN